MGCKLALSLLVLLVALAGGGCSADSGPNDKHVSGKEINDMRAKALSPEDREKMEKLRGGAAIGGKGR